MMERSEWLLARKKGIGGSDASVVAGHNRYKDPLTLYKEKLGLIPEEDLSEKAAVQFGIQMEPILRETFIMSYPEFKVLSGVEMQWSEKYPFMYANTDGMLVDEDGRKGVLEIKTASVHNLNSWTRQIPQAYYLQILHYLIVTEADFAILYAWIRPNWGESDTDAWVRKFVIEREGREKEMEILIQKEAEFWGFIERKEKPPFKMVI